MSKKIVTFLIIIFITIGIVICCKYKSVNQKETQSTTTTTMEILDKKIYVVGTWKIKNIEEDGTEIGIYDALGTIAKQYTPEIILNEDLTFSNNIGKNASEDETPTTGTYKVEENKVILTYSNNTTEILEYEDGYLKYNLRDNIIIYLEKEILNYAD